MGEILIIEDNKIDLKLLSTLIRTEGFEISKAETMDLGTAMLENEPFQVVFIDLATTFHERMAFAEDLRTRFPETSLILTVSEEEQEEHGLRSDYGSVAYVNKPFKINELLKTVQDVYEYEEISQGEENAGEIAICNFFVFPTLVTESKAMQETAKHIERVATIDLPVLICGATNTEKALVAKAIHARSKRAEQAINCLDVKKDEDFLSQELTLAQGPGREKGIFEKNKKGTIFVDNIQILPEAEQDLLANMLQTLKNQKKQGGETPRFLAGSEQDAKTMQNWGFNPTLLTLLSSFTIAIPPLSKRREDIIPLFTQFLREKTQNKATHFEIEDAVKEKMLSRKWAGNVAELEALADCISDLLPTGSTRITATTLLDALERLSGY
jgi:DNA-binding NtrC family response regulator